MFKQYILQMFLALLGYVFSTPFNLLFLTLQLYLPNM